MTGIILFTNHIMPKWGVSQFGLYLVQTKLTQLELLALERIALLLRQPSAFIEKVALHLW